jgi:NAD(P)H-flavin reductase
MNRIVTKKSISEDLVQLEIKTNIATSAIQPGQYIQIRMEESTPGISLPVLKSCSERETVTVLVSATNQASRQLSRLNAGSHLLALDGPFGHPAHISNFGTVLCVARGQSIVALYPLINALRKAGNSVVAVLSAKTGEGILLQDEINQLADRLQVITDDGSLGAQASVCSMVGQMVRSQRFEQVFVTGPAKTVRETCSHASKHKVPVQAVLHLQKLAEKGRHGFLNVSIWGSERAVCVDGTNFNAWFPNFEEMVKRFGGDDSEQKSVCEMQGELVLMA